ncbi:GNAT family N-acetyltransferase [Vibrio marisflavi]|uniref:N-acetyltransferase domain-containing protein n=1 Tax=Vibrio marisflavi CECT 7928 TaxID=634439 RepID=A0ABN8EAZ6_9VIBR|nr:GNAT family N-acetyltransferase [Vibrio marisflavi]CAH0541743.1 hypothetical protein VMF7928_03801 [Vibrio marisflavi CECT 7928]
MSKLRIELLEPIKLPLITKLYKAHYPSGKAKKNEKIIVGYLDNQIVAVVRLRSIAPYRLLTGMLVIPEQRGFGFASELLQFCQQYELKEKDYCFAYPHLEQFYLSQGFKKVNSRQLPTLLEQLFSRYTNCGKALIAMQYIDNQLYC